MIFNIKDMFSCQQINNQICFRFVYMICLAIDYYLVKKNSIYFILSLGIFLCFYTEVSLKRRSLQSKNDHDHRVLNRIVPCGHYGDMLT